MLKATAKRIIAKRDKDDIKVTIRALALKNANAIFKAFLTF